MNIDDLKKLVAPGRWWYGSHNPSVYEPTVRDEFNDAIVLDAREYHCREIVALHNLAPELIAVVEAAQAARQFPVPAYSEDRLDGALEVLAAKLAQQEKAQ